MLLDPGLKVPCVILPGRKYEFLLPSTAVVEVLPTQILDDAQQDSMLEWRDQKVPVINLDDWGTQPGPVPHKSIIVVLRLPTTPPRYVALPLRDKPRILNASQRNLELDYHPRRTHPLAQMYARSQNHTLVLLDWYQVAEQLASGQSQ